MSEVKYKYCPKCGTQMQIKEGGICTSIPPMFRYKCPVCGNVEFDPDKYPMPVIDLDKNYGSVAPPFFFDWQVFRAEAAKAAMVGLLAGRKTRPDKEEVCKSAVLYANELVKQLKEDGKED